jgi:hypothetical protein
MHVNTYAHSVSTMSDWVVPIRDLRVEKRLRQSWWHRGPPIRRSGRAQIPGPVSAQLKATTSRCGSLGEPSDCHREPGAAPTPLRPGSASGSVPSRSAAPRCWHSASPASGAAASCATPSSANRARPRLGACGSLSCRPESRVSPGPYRGSRRRTSAVPWNARVTGRTPSPSPA